MAAKDIDNAFPEIHDRHNCDECKTAPIIGVRYHCSKCKNYDICSVCEKTT